MKAGQHSLGERARQPIAWVLLAAGWIPVRSLWRDAVETRLVRRRLVEGLALLATVPAVEILEQLHEAGALPFYVALP